MICTRRHAVWLGGYAIATIASSRVALAHLSTTIEMRGSPRGERIWYDPIGIAVSPGTTIRFINRNPENSHTVTAYHPANYNRMRRIPAEADPWNSDFLLPDEYFEFTLTAPGVYDYYCLPNEMAAVVGRILFGTPNDTGWEGSSNDKSDVSEDVLTALPLVQKIRSEGTVRKEDGS
ncbi:plastocyanin/azurin family copper-binding protein [Ruegeria sp. Alg231-54]|uniref:plastocyanin/azurin family copper-binding protein n=1 Tax=Ruegeria sp. Alg231-54 TaxID=1922221 RepID=UPI000D54F596|nr:plastocyanin/azurin family copper-binding protein [Ruegeria sp. Alg231-54]